MKGHIEPRVSERTGKRTYRPKVRLSERERRLAGLDKAWQYNGSYDRLRKHPTEPSAEAALEELQERLRRLIAGEQPAPQGSTETLRVLYARWMRDQVTPNERENTARSYRLAFKDHVLEVVVRVDESPVRMGDIVACELTSADVAEWQAAQLTGGRLDGKAGGCGVKSVRNYRGALHLLFGWLRGIMPEAFKVNPVEGVSAPRWRRKAPTPPTLAVAQQYVEALRDTRLWPALLIGQNAGMRRGEVLALRWCDAHWRVEQGKDKRPRLVGGVRIHPERGNLTGRTRDTLRFGPPKTDAGPRYVPLTETALAGLVELKAERQRKLPDGETWSDDALICCGRRGQPIVPDNLTHELPLRLRRRDLPPVSFHKLRHMVATEMRRAGVDRDVLAAFLGHADITTTAIYDHVSEDDQQAAAAIFEARCREAEETRRAQSEPKRGIVVKLAERMSSK